MLTEVHVLENDKGYVCFDRSTSGSIVHWNGWCPAVSCNISLNCVSCMGYQSCRKYWQRFPSVRQYRGDAPAHRRASTDWLRRRCEFIHVPEVLNNADQVSLRSSLSSVLSIGVLNGQGMVDIMVTNVMRLVWSRLPSLGLRCFCPWNTL